MIITILISKQKFLFQFFKDSDSKRLKILKIVPVNEQKCSYKNGKSIHKTLNKQI